jgi:histone H1/5
MTAAVERGMRLASVEFARDVIHQLNKEGALTCSLEEAMKLFDFESVSIVSSRSKASKKRENAKSRGGEKKSSKAKITAKPSVVLPFCGVIVDDWCAGVKFNHGLHTQCTQGRCKDDRYCKTCRKHADNSATGKPPYGDIEDRANYGVDYRDPKGKMTVPYANVAEKMGISLEAAHTAAANMEWEIPAEQLVKQVAKRGRPAKSAAVSDTDSEDGDSKTSTKKKRGRPTKPKAKPTTQEDQIAMLVAEAYAETASTKTVKKAKKPKVTAEEKAAAKLAKKEAAEKLKAEKKAAKEAEKEAAKLAKKEAAEKLKAEKKAEKEAAKLAKKEAADKLKADKLAAKKLEKEQKAAAKATAKAEKLALAKAKAAKTAKKSKTAKLKVPVAEVKPVVDEEKTAVEEAVVEADLFLGTDDVAAQQSVMPKSDELDFEDIDDAADSSDDEEAGLELSETMTVGGVEYFFTEQDGQTILFTKDGEPVGIYDADTDTVQECEFDEE